MFGDNEPEFDSLMKTHSKLHKRHTALSFRRVCESIAAEVDCFIDIRGINPAALKNWIFKRNGTCVLPSYFGVGYIIGPVQCDMEKDEG